MMQNNKRMIRVMLLMAVLVLGGLLPAKQATAQPDTTPPEAPIPGVDGVLIGADYWSDEPMILSAGLGFEDIIGVDEASEEAIMKFWAPNSPT